MNIMKKVVLSVCAIVVLGSAVLADKRVGTGFSYGHIQVVNASYFTNKDLGSGTGQGWQVGWVSPQIESYEDDVRSEGVGFFLEAIDITYPVKNSNQTKLANQYNLSLQLPVTMGKFEGVRASLLMGYRLGLTFIDDIDGRLHQELAFGGRISLFDHVYLEATQSIRLDYIEWGLHSDTLAQLKVVL